MDLKELSYWLVNYAHVPHCYFEHGSLLLVNVSSSPDGAQEFAVYKKDDKYYKIESLTVSWMTEERLFILLQEYDSTPIDGLLNPWNDKPIKEHPLGNESFTFDRFETYRREYKKFAETY